MFFHYLFKSFKKYEDCTTSEVEMYRRAGRIVMVIAIVSAFCLTAVAGEAVSLPSSHAMKFTERIEEKQAMLYSMRQNSRELMEMTTSFALYRHTLADEKYLTRLEGRMGTLINETLRDAETSNPAAFRPIMPSTLMPESRCQRKNTKGENKEISRR